MARFCPTIRPDWITAVQPLSCKSGENASFTFLHQSICCCDCEWAIGASNTAVALNPTATKPCRNVPMIFPQHRTICGGRLSRLHVVGLFANAFAECLKGSTASI